MKNDYKRNYFWSLKINGEYKYFFKIKGSFVEISKEVYFTCKNSYRKIHRDNKRDYEILAHYEDIDLAISHSNFLVTFDIVNYVYKNTLYENLHLAIKSLTEYEQNIIELIYLQDKTEREVATILNIPNTTLHNKKVRILKKLKKYLEQLEL